MGAIQDLQNARTEITRLKEEAQGKYTPRENNWCQDADRFIKELDVRIAQYSKDKINGSLGQKLIASGILPVLEEKRSNLQILFVNKECASKLEQKKALETAGIIGQEVAKYEEDVLGGSDKERQKLFIIGGVVLLGALGIILFSQKKK